MINVAILGASGYGALELIKILLRHPSAKIVALTSRETEEPHITTLHPSLIGRLDLKCELFDPENLTGRVDCAFLSLPHKASMSAAAPLLERGIKVIDLSADYRLRDPNVYAEWYGESHADTRNLSHAVYGLTELFADEIAPAKLVANPGCYPTAATLGLAPLLAGNLIEREGIIIDAKSGVSGAGRSPKLTTHFPECNESVSAYNVGWHRHTPEIDQNLSTISGQPISVIFTPHLIPMDRGIFSTAYARLSHSMDDEQLLGIYRDFYAGKPFVRVIEHLPTTKDVAASNFCDITVRQVKGRVIILSTIDNLIKGAAGQAIQNFNLMYGYPETTALL